MNESKLLGVIKRVSELSEKLTGVISDCTDFNAKKSIPVIFYRSDVLTTILKSFVSPLDNNLKKMHFNPRSILESAVEIVRPLCVSQNIEIESLIDSSFPDKVVGYPEVFRQLITIVLFLSLEKNNSNKIRLKAIVSKIDEQMIRVSIDITCVVNENSIHFEESLYELIEIPLELLGGICKSENGFTHVSLIFNSDECSDEFCELKILKGKSLVIVSESEFRKEIFVDYLIKSGLVIYSVSNESEIIELFYNGEKTIDLVIIDSELKNSDPFELAKKIKFEYTLKDVKLILFIANSKCDHWVNPLQEIFSGYISSPLKKEYLLDFLKDILGSRINCGNNTSNTFNSVNELNVEPRSSILLVDDNQINQTITGLILKKLGYSYSVVSSGQEALDLLKEKKFDLVLMDCMMPLMNGYECTEAIRNSESTNSKIPIIALTGADTENDMKRCFDSGMNDYLTKPIESKVLKNALERWIKSEIHSSEIKKLEESIITSDEKSKIVIRMAGSLLSLVDSIEASILISDFVAIKSSAHALKGAAANLDLTKISLLSKDIEKDPSNALDKISELKRECAFLHNHIEKPKTENISIEHSLTHEDFTLIENYLLVGEMNALIELINNLLNKNKISGDLADKLIKLSELFLFEEIEVYIKSMQS